MSPASRPLRGHRSRGRCAFLRTSRNPEESRTIGYSMFGREEEARYHVAEGLKTNPIWSLELEQQIYSYKNPADLERQLDALRKVGLPEHPPKKASD